MEKGTILKSSKEEKIKAFIKNNNLTFSGNGSELNSVCTIISGYGLHIGIDNYEELENIIVNSIPDVSSEFGDEIKRVFYFAKNSNYQNYWKYETAKKMYKF